MVSDVRVLSEKREDNMQFRRSLLCLPDPPLAYCDIVRIKVAVPKKKWPNSLVMMACHTNKKRHYSDHYNAFAVGMQLQALDSIGSCIMQTGRFCILCRKIILSSRSFLSCVFFSLFKTTFFVLHFFQLRLRISIENLRIHRATASENPPSYMCEISQNS